MKSVLLATAAISLFAAPALAQDAVGSIGVAYVNTQIDDVDAEADGAVIDGSVALPAFGDWTVTLDGTATFADSDISDDTTLAGSAHLTKVFGSDLRAGGFVGASDAGSDTLFTVGAEVQKYFASATLTGVVSYGNVDDIDIWSVGGDAAYYVQPNLRLNAGLSWNNVDTGFGDVDAWTYGVGAEYQFADTPFGLFADYTRVSLDDVDVDVDTFKVGFRYSFGGGLQARDRSGADLGRTVSGVGSLIGGL
jgi:opacity protein-like surface antigen